MARDPMKTSRSKAHARGPHGKRPEHWSRERRLAFRDKLVNWGRRQVRCDEAALAYHHLEFTWLPRNLSFFIDMPMAVDGKLAQSILRARDNEVIPIQELELYHVSQWVAESFLKAGRHVIHDEAASVPSSHFLTDGEFEAYREGADFRYGFSDVRDEEFEAVTRTVCSFVRRAIAKHGVTLGAVLHLLPFPFGRNTVRKIPLVDDNWVDQQLLDLVVFCQILYEQGFACLPAIDPHPVAFERVFSKEMHWPNDAIELKDELPREVDDRELGKLRSLCGTT